MEKASTVTPAHLQIKFTRFQVFLPYGKINRAKIVHWQQVQNTGNRSQATSQVRVHNSTLQ